MNKELITKRILYPKNSIYFDYAEIVSIIDDKNNLVRYSYNRMTGNLILLSNTFFISYIDIKYWTNSIKDIRKEKYKYLFK